MIVLLMTLFLSLTCYSNDTTKLNLREITKYLAEGVECKEILLVRNQQILLRDTIIYNQNRIILLHKDKDSLQTKRYDALVLDNDVCNEQYNKQGKRLLRIEKINKILSATNIGFIVALLMLL